jgi:hypothetical protein
MKHKMDWNPGERMEWIHRFFKENPEEYYWNITPEYAHIFPGRPLHSKVFLNDLAPAITSQEHKALRDYICAEIRRSLNS